MGQRNYSRRRILQIGAASALWPGVAFSGGNAKAVSNEAIKLVIIGGGFGGVAAARYARAQLPNAKVTLLTDKADYWLAPSSNEVIAGLRELSTLKVSYEPLKALGVDVVIDQATGVDAEKRSVSTKSGSRLQYDKLILSPGVAFDYSGIDGLSQSDEDRVPHAWIAGPQTTLLRDQIRAMEDGSFFVMSYPRTPLRCPPALAERACLIADYFKRHKPKSKIIILDANDHAPFEHLFVPVWEQHYADYIDYRNVANDGIIRGVDPNGLIAMTDFEEFEAGAINVVPKQFAGEIAAKAGTVDETGWCPVDVLTSESTLVPDIHVIGDAAFANPIPKAGSAAVSQAAVAVSAIAAKLNGNEPPQPTWQSDCYALSAPAQGLRLGSGYTFKDGEAHRTVLDHSSPDDDTEARTNDARLGAEWLSRIKSEVWG